MEEKLILQTPKHDLYADTILRDDEWSVQAGARARSNWVGSTDAKTHYGKLCTELMASGILSQENGFAIFKQDYAFSSPSAAGAVINGRSTNGRQAWKHAISGQSYEDWEKAQIAAEVTS